MPPKKSRSQAVPGLNFKPRPRPATKVLNHAIIGDIIGVPYEFLQNNIFTTEFELYDDPNRPNLKTASHLLGHNQTSIYSDDSLTQDFIAQALMETWGKSDEEIVQACLVRLKECVRTSGSVAGGFGTGFRNWAAEKGNKIAHSCGDGSAMRVGAVPWMCNSLEQVLHLAELTAKPSHDHPEAIKGAQAVAAATYLARAGVDKEGIKAYLETKFGYDMDKTVADHRQRNIDRKAAGKGQDEICQFVVPMALRAFYEGTSFEDSIRLAVSIGGDSDTIGAMVGAMAGAFYPMPKQMEQDCEKRSNDRLREGAKKFDEFIDKLDIEPRMDEVELAIADAKLKQYILRQAKAGNQAAPEDDPKFRDLLAEKEAIRLYYDELNRVRQRNDGVYTEDRDLLQYEQLLIDKKADHVQQLKEFVQASPEFKQQFAEMQTWPAETVQVPDWNTNRYDKKKKEYVQDPRPEIQIDSRKYPGKILNQDNVLPGILAPEMERKVVPAAAKNAIEQLNQYIKTADENARKSANAEQAPETKQIEWAKKTVEKLNALPCMKGEYHSASMPGDKVSQNRAAYEEAYRQLGEQDFDLKNDAIGAQQNAGPLNAESNIASVTNDLRELLRDQIRTLDAFDEVRGSNKTYFETVDAKLRKDDAIDKAMEQLPNVVEPPADMLTLGRKSERYCVAYVNSMVNGENGISEYFPPYEKMPKVLQGAMDDLEEMCKAETTFDRLDYSGEALYKLKQVSKDLSGRLDNNLDEQLVGQAAFVNRLIKAVEDVRNAPEEPRQCEAHQMVYDRLNASAAAVGTYMDTLPTESNMFKLAQRAQESMKNIQQAVAAEAFGEKENGLTKLAGTNDYATVGLYQMMRKITDPKTLREFETNALDKSIEKMNKSKGCANLRKGATVDMLKDATRYPGALLDKITGVKPQAQKNIVLDPKKLTLDEKPAVHGNGMMTGK